MLSNIQMLKCPSGMSESKFHPAFLKIIEPWNEINLLIVLYNYSNVSIVINLSHH